MINLEKLSEYTDMTKEQLQESIERLDMKTFLENPTQAMIDAGVTLKEGFIFKLVETEEEANALPANEIPLMRSKNNEALSMENLDKVAGGRGFSDGYYRARSQGFDAGEAYENRYGRHDEKKT